MTDPADNIQLRTLAGYLEKRKELISAREALFSAIRTYLRPEQRPDAELLGDSLHASKARDVSDAEFVFNAVRGYLTVLEAPAKGRMFRLSVLQQGNELRIGVSHPELNLVDKHQASLNLERVFAHTQPVHRKRDDQVFMDWHFAVPELYQCAQNFEDAIFKVSAIFESALHQLQAPQ